MDIFTIAASGMRAAQTQANVAANNIANANTPGFKAKSAQLTEAPTGGVSVSAVQQTGHSVDLPTEQANLKRAALMYDANGTVIRVANQMLHSMLNILDNQYQTRDIDADQSLPSFTDTTR
jgi:flagellar hook protein FlgE